MRLLYRWLVTALALWMLPNLLGGIRVDGFSVALGAAAILSVLNAVIRPLVVFFTLPLTVLSLGLFLFVINGMMLYWTSGLVAGFEVASFGTAFIASLVISLVSWVMDLSVGFEGGKRIIILRGGKVEPGTRRTKDLN